MDDVGGEKAMLGGEQHKQSTGLENGMMMLDCAWGSWRGMSQRKGEEEGEGERGKGKGEGKDRKSADI